MGILAHRLVEKLTSDGEEGRDGTVRRVCARTGCAALSRVYISSGIIRDRISRSTAERKVVEDSTNSTPIRKSSSSPLRTAVTWRIFASVAVVSPSTLRQTECTDATASGNGASKRAPYSDRSISRVEASVALNVPMNGPTTSNLTPLRRSPAVCIKPGMPQDPDLQPCKLVAIRSCCHHYSAIVL